VQTKLQLNACALAADNISKLLHVGEKKRVVLATLLLRYIKHELLSKVGVQQWVWIIKSANINWPKETEQKNVFIPLSLQSLYKTYGINKKERWRAKFIQPHLKKKGTHNIIAALMYAKEINQKSDAIFNCHLPNLSKVIRDLEDTCTIEKTNASKMILNEAEVNIDAVNKENAESTILLQKLRNTIRSFDREHELWFH
jgi:hypothetical protein